MTDHADSPLLFLDVDVPLLPFGDGPQHEPSGDASTSHLARLDPRVGHRLTALPCVLVWATTWEEEANAEIAPRIGLPRLPGVLWPEACDAHERENQWFGLDWKTRTVVAWADGRLFAWVDDEITTPIGTGCRCTIPAEPSSMTLCPHAVSPTTTSQSSTNGYAQAKSPMIHRN
jgi:hypothetical protein